MVSPRVIKSPVVTGDVYTISPRPSATERQRASSIVADALKLADSIVAEAQLQAVQIRQQAERERTEQLESMRSDLLAEARVAVLAELETDKDRTFRRFRHLVDQACVAEAELRRSASVEMIGLATVIAEQVIAREVRTDPETVLRIAEEVLAAAPEMSSLQLFVHPDELPTVEAWSSVALGEEFGKLILTPDPQVGRGGCVLGTRTGFIDGQIETRIVEIRRALAEVIEDA